jgi:hypothetical protein
MLPFSLLADVPPAPFLVGGGVVVLAAAGLCIALVVGIFGYLKRRNASSADHQLQNTDNVGETEQ